MPLWFNSLLNLFSYSWENLIQSLGTTTLAIFISTAIAVIIYLRRFYLTWIEEQKKRSTLKNIFKRSLRWEDLLFYLLLWFIIFGYFTAQTIYSDHEALKKRIVILSKERDQYKQNVDDRDKTINGLKSIITKNSGIPKEPLEKSLITDRKVTDLKLLQKNGKILISDIKQYSMGMSKEEKELLQYGGSSNELMQKKINAAHKIFANIFHSRIKKIIDQYHQQKVITEGEWLAMLDQSKDGAYDIEKLLTDLENINYRIVP